MFKKSMAALAVLSLSAGLASASEVTLYGIVDNGLLYTHSKVEDDGVSTKTDSFGLEGILLDAVLDGEPIATKEGRKTPEAESGTMN